MLSIPRRTRLNELHFAGLGINTNRPKNRLSHGLKSLALSVG